MRAGKFKELIDIHEYKTIQSTISGQLTTTWTTMASAMWANMEYVRGDESYLGSIARRLERTSRIFTVRFSSLTSAIGADDRIVFKSENYDIRAVENVDNENNYLSILAESIK